MNQLAHVLIACGVVLLGAFVVARWNLARNFVKALTAGTWVGITSAIFIVLGVILLVLPPPAQTWTSTQLSTMLTKELKLPSKYLSTASAELICDANDLSGDCIMVTLTGTIAILNNVAVLTPDPGQSVSMSVPLMMQNLPRFGSDQDHINAAVQQFGGRPSPVTVTGTMRNVGTRQFLAVQ